MFAGLLLVLASLCIHANGDDAVAIDVCNIPTPVMGAPAPVQRPSVPVDNCQDRDVLACFEIFKPQDDPVELGRVLNENRME